MIVDAKGNEIEKPEQHQFGFFKIPENAHIKGFGTITGDGHRRELFDESCKETSRLRDRKDNQ